MDRRVALPIDVALPEITERMLRGDARGRRRNLVLEAPPGAGKTTQIPGALLEAGLAGEIIVLQPRRLAARMAAARVASLLGEAVGDRCGYEVRFDARTSPATRIRFVTDGVLLRRLRDQHDLPGVSLVILDEFHERHLDAELSLALLRRLQRERRPELRLIVMSATLDGDAVSRYLDCDTLKVTGRAHAVDIAYRPIRGSHDRDALPAAVSRALSELLADEPPRAAGHVLVFLPGMKEIRECAARCRAQAMRAGMITLHLHGELDRAEQDRAVAPGGPRKLILATNVAQTSVTIDGVVAVIDSGLARVARHDPWSGLARLDVAPISRAAATQRAGRAGRTGPGRCIRLYSEQDLLRRPEHDAPEIERDDLCGHLLDLAAAGITDLDDFEWFAPPPPASLAAARELLRRLSAIDEHDRLTEIGRAMSSFPVHPRLARLIVEACRTGIAQLGADVAALLGERSIRRERGEATRDLDSDPLADLADLEELSRREAADATPGSDRRPELDGAALAVLRRSRARLRELARAQADAKGPSLSRDARESALRRALLVAFPDRVAWVRDEAHGGRTAMLAGGGFAPLSAASVVRTAPWIVALAVGERREGGHRRREVSLASAIEPEWIVELFADRVRDEQHLHFDGARDQVVGSSELRFDGLVLAASTMRRLPAAASTTLLAAARSAGLSRLCDAEALEALRCRVHLLVRFGALASTVDDAAFEAACDAALAAACEGRTSFAELRDCDLLARIRVELGDPAVAVDRLLPARIRLPGGRSAAVHYEREREPWVASRLQDFFGLARGPTLLDGRLAIVMHLRAPNGRDLQVTTDLAGFWANHYPQLRRALMRRYPRHAWPEDPLREISPATGRSSSPR